MPKYVIEREVPGAGQMSAEDLHAISAKSNSALDQVGPAVQWVQTYVTGNKLFCVYNAKDESLIREHARIGGFPCDQISQVRAIIDPVNGEAVA